MPWRSSWAQTIFNKLNIPDFKAEQGKAFLENVRSVSLQRYLDEWKADLVKIEAKNGNGQNKLRTYRVFKQQFGKEENVKINSD